ncbi:Sulfide:quinone oxidoreductase like protein [Verticillium longisporum]|nr:Sulfide:quinone oxidoreductase like protein [Verticillium longisporum]
MFSRRALRATSSVAGRLSASKNTASLPRYLATAAAPVTSADSGHKVVVVGAGTAGLAISHQLLRTGQFSPDDIAIVDPAEWHHYQPGWTLFYNNGVGSFSPESNSLTLQDGRTLSYDQLVVASGVSVDFGSVKGLPEALANPDALVSSIYGYDSCDKVFPSVQKLQKGAAIFTQPAGVIKCAGAPQKVMWLALDHWKQVGLYDPSNPASSAIKISFASGLGGMFAVPKYAAALEALRQERNVEGLFLHDLVAIDGNTATFARPDGQDQVKKHFDFLHVTPKMGPHAFIKNSSLANGAGYVDVDDGTTQHKKFPNVWSAGDVSSLPTSKTAAAITAEAPVLVRNLLQTTEGKAPDAVYDGYTSCPLTTEYGKVLLAEFKYGGQPKETFGDLIGFDQAVPRRAFYHLKKDFFPWVYFNNMVNGTWGGPKGFLN